jgi:hypothetical protein
MKRDISGRTMFLLGIVGLALLAHSSGVRADLTVTVPSPLTIFEGKSGFDTFMVTNSGLGDVQIRGVRAHAPNTGGDRGDRVTGAVPVDDHVGETLHPGDTISIEYQLSTTPQDAGEPIDQGVVALIFSIRGENPLTGKFESGNGTAVVFVQDVPATPAPEPSTLAMVGTGILAMAALGWSRRRGRSRG